MFAAFSQHFRYFARIEKEPRLMYCNKLTKQEAETFTKGSLQSIKDVYAFLQAQCRAKSDIIVDRWQAKNHGIVKSVAMKAHLNRTNT